MAEHPAYTHIVWGRIERDVSDSPEEGSTSSHSVLPLAEDRLLTLSDASHSESEQNPKEAGQESRADTQKSEQKPDSESIPAQESQEELHKQGNCSPCVYKLSHKVCPSGESCTWCHEPHLRTIPSRPRKSARASCRDKAGQLDVLAKTDPEAFVENAKLLMRQGSYMRTVVKSKLKCMGREDIDDDSSPRTAAEMESSVTSTVATQPPQQVTQVSPPELSQLKLATAEFGTLEL